MKKRYREAAFVLLLTLVGMALFYSAQYDVDASTDQSLEAAIEAYGSGDQPAVDILQREKLGRHLLVTYRQVDHPGFFGTALLQRGVFGKYTFLERDNTNMPLYNARMEELDGRHYLLVYGFHQLPQVGSYVVKDAAGWNLWWGGQETGPFLHVTEMPQAYPLGWDRVLYYDTAGQQLFDTDLLAQFPCAEGGAHNSTSTAELGLMPLILGFFLLIGCAISYGILKF